MKRKRRMWAVIYDRVEVATLRGLPCIAFTRNRAARVLYKSP